MHGKMVAYRAAQLALDQVTKFHLKFLCHVSLSGFR